MEKGIRTKIHFQRELLIQVKHQSHLAAERTRAEILLAYSAQLSRVRIRHVVGCSLATISRTLSDFVDHGCWAVIDFRRLGNARKSGRDKVIELLPDIVKRQPREFGWGRARWSAELIREQVIDQTGVEYSTRQIQNLLIQADCRLRRPKPTIRRRPHDWRAQMRHLMYELSDLPEGDVILYADEVKLELNPKSGPDWMAPGQRKKLLTPGQNNTCYAAGAYNPITDNLVVVDGPKNKTELFVRLCEQVASRYRGWGTVHLIVDNYCTHTSQGTKQALRQLAGKIQLHFLPPYCPDENDIERVWWDVHENVTRNHRCDTIDELLSQVYEYIENYIEHGSRGAGHQKAA